MQTAAVAMAQTAIDLATDPAALQRVVAQAAGQATR
jgi:hypothetical protein